MRKYYTTVFDFIISAEKSLILKKILCSFYVFEFFFMSDFIFL